jgi:thiamine kinase-like enzyme
MRETESIRRVAQALRAVHRGPSLPARFISFRVVEDYRTTAFLHGAEVPPSFAWARQIARQVERARGAFPERPCHNDLLNANFIDDGERIRIVDWEYAGMGDPFFDLGNFSVNHDLTADEDTILLEAYEGEVRPPRLARLFLMRIVSDFREAMWGVLQQGISTLDVDFVAYADEHFERLLHNASGPGFEEHLREAARG